MNNILERIRYRREVREHRELSKRLSDGIKSLRSFANDVVADKDSVLKDYTLKIKRFFHKVGKIPDWYGIFMMTGSFGAGKTAGGFIFGFNLLRYDHYVKYSNLTKKQYPRTMCLYKSTEFLLEKAREKCREYCIKNGIADLSERIYLANDESEIKDNSFCLADEGISLFFKEDSNRKEQKEFVKDITELRHHRITWWFNTGDHDISTKLRNKATWEIYKKQSRKALNNIKKTDKFQAKWEDELLDLSVKEYIFNTTDKWFVEDCRGGYIEGRFSLDLHNTDYGCGWFDEELSSSNDSKQYKGSIHRLEDRIERVYDPIIKYIIENKDPEEISKRKWMLYVMGIIQEEFVAEYQTIQDNRQEFFQRFVKLLKEGNFSSRDFHIDTQVRKHWLFCKFMKENTIDSLESNTIYLYLQGLGQTNIATELTKSAGTINSIVRKYQDEHFGNRLEDYVHLIYDYKPAEVHNTHDPDMIDREGRIVERDYAISIKFSSKRRNEQEFKLEDLKPEFNYARDSGQDYFYLLYHNPKWDFRALLLQKVYVNTLKEKKSLKIKKSKYNLKNQTLSDSEMSVLRFENK